MDRLKALLKQHWPLLIVLAIGLTLYGHALHNGFVDDDTSQISDNPYIGQYSSDLKPVYSTTYHRPLMLMLFTTTDILFGKNPFWFHLPQVLLFLASVVLIYMFFYKFFGRRIASILSLVVAIHPLNVDTVAYISHIQDVLFVFFGLLAWLAIDRWRARPSWQLLVTIALLIFASILSKESGVLWVPLLAVYAYFFKREYLKPVVAGLVGGALLYGLFLLLAPHGDIATNSLVGPLAHKSFWQRQVSTPAILWFYLRTFLWPAQLNVGYGWSVDRIGSLHFWGPLTADLIFLAGLVAGAYYVKARAPQKLRLYMYFVIWFAVSMAVLFQVFPLDATVAERWFYVPMLGLLGLLGVIASTLNFHKLKPVLQSFVLAVLIIGFGALFVRSYVRISNFSDNLNLLRHDAQANETNYRILNELGILLERNNQYNEAGYFFQKSLAIQKQDNNAWAGLGSVAIDVGDMQLAEYYLAGSVQYNSTYVLGYYNLATLYLNENRPAEAAGVLKKGLAKWPADPGLEARMADANKALAAAKPGS